MAHRYISALRGHHTNNFAEVTVRLFKDNVLTQCKAYNAVALLDLIVTVLERFYRNRLERFANGRVTVYSLHFERILQSCNYITNADQIRKNISDTGLVTYHVPSESTKGLLYEVEHMSGICSCTAGMSGRCCKHQAAVFKFDNEALPNLPSTTTEDKYAAAYIALGSERQPRTFYLALKESEQVTENELTEQPSTSTEEVAISVPEPESISSIAEVEQYSKADLMRDARTLCTDFMNLIDEQSTDSNANELSSALNVFHRFFSSIRTSSQLVSYLHSSSKSVPLKRRAGAMIAVQPTALSRLKALITHGAKSPVSL